MPGGEDERELDLRLPWGSSAAPPPGPPSLPQPQEATTPSASAGAGSPASTLDSDMENLLFVLKRRFDRIEKRLELIGSALPKLIERTEASLAENRTATLEEVRQLLAEQPERVNDEELNRRLDGLKNLLLGSYATLLEAVSQITPMPPPQGEPVIEDALSPQPEPAAVPPPSGLSSS